MTVTLTPERELPLLRSVEQGRYASVQEALDTAVDLLIERERRLERLKLELAPAIEASERGEGREIDPARVHDYLDSLRPSR